MAKTKTRLRPIGEEDILALPHHVADTIGTGYRLELHHALQEQHDANRDDNSDPGFASILIVGQKGEGKSNVASHIGAAYYARGFNVASNLSLLYGHHIESALDLFAFSRALPGRCVVVVDEIQNLLSRYTMASLKSQLFIQALAELRKRRITIIGITSQEVELNPSYKYEVDFVLYPRQRRYVRIPTRKGQERYDKWCHLKVRRLGPRPFAYDSGKTVGEKYGLSPSTKKPKWSTLNNFGPKQVYAAAARQSSFASLPWGKDAGTSVTAADMREALDSGGTIEFEVDDDLEVDDPQGIVAAEQSAYQEQLQLDQTEVTRLWHGVISLGLQTERTIPLALLLTKLSMGGNVFVPSELEDLLSRWTSRRSGTNAPVSLEELRAWFTPRG